MSRQSLIDVYISSLPYAAVSIIPAAPGSRVEVGGPSKPAFYFKMTHIELVLGRAGLHCGPVDQPPAAVAALIEQAAAKLGATVIRPDELRKAAEIQVDEISARIRAENQDGTLKSWNARYKHYRRAQVEKREPAIPYSAFLEQFVIAPTVRDVAMTGRMI